MQLNLLGRRIAAALSVATLLLTAAHAFSYVAGAAKWTLNRTVTMHLSLGAPRPLSDGFASFNASAADALNVWNQYLIHMKFHPFLNSPLQPAQGDTDTSVFFASDVYGEAFGDRVLAVTSRTPRDAVIAEADVRFNNHLSWDSYRGPLRSAYDFHRVALHEFGHVVGLDHPDQAGQTVTALMNSVISNLDSLQRDDINGAHALYDDGPAYLSSNSAPVLVNLSTRAAVGTGDDVLMAGFIIQGSAPATVILRGIGHSLAAIGINHPLTDPVIELRDSTGALVDSSDDWITPSDASTIASYHLDPSNSRESALLATLSPGSYTVTLRAFDNGDGDLSGTGIVELYDLHKTAGRAGNLSSRGQVFPDDGAMFAGVIVGGSATKEVVLRGLGPSLADNNVANALADPTLELRDASGNLVRQNDDWADDSEAAAVQSSGLAPTRSEESALHATLNPGAYTAILRGANATSGIGLVEVYDLSAAP